MDLPPHADPPAFRPSPPLQALVDRAVVDAELAALLCVLVERRIPLVVCGEIAMERRTAVLDALLSAAPANVRLVPVAGPTEDFTWLPEAESLGWRPDGETPGRVRLEPATAESTVIHVGDLDAHGPTSTWAGVARIAVRAVAVGYGLAAASRAPSLESFLDLLRRPPFRLTEDELSRLGVVVVLGDRAVGSAEPDDRRGLVTAAHYVRPVARDMHGHIQRMGPAVLATGDPASGRFEHFAWGVLPELAARIGFKAGDLELEIDRRREAFERVLTASAGEAAG